MVTQRRGREIDMALDVTRGGTSTAGLHDEAQHLEPHGMAECAQLLGMTFELRGHHLVLTFSKKRRKAFFENSRRLRQRPRSAPQMCTWRRAPSR
jgi:hypothetical protein